jgi:putative transposase
VRRLGAQSIPKGIDMAQKQKCNLGLYRDFLIANQNRYSGVELSRVEPTGSMSHDSVTRWLMKADFRPQDIWQFAKPLVKIETGYLVLDDTVVSKPFAKNIDLARWQYSGREHTQVNGIGIVNLLWTDSTEYVPVDYRLYAPDHDGKGKNDHFRDMLDKAEKRDFAPTAVLFDSWYSGLDNLKAIRKKDWHWVTDFKRNRLVSLEPHQSVAISDLDLDDGTVKQVWLKGYGEILVCRLVLDNNDTRYLASSDLTLTDYDTFVKCWGQRWPIETFHRGIKQTTGLGECSAQRTHAQKIHIFSSMVAFLKLEAIRQRTGQTWYEQKASITRPAVQEYLLANA